MPFYLIRLKRFPHRFISKKNTAYAFTSDQEIKETKRDLDPEAHWFCEEKYAKIWTTLPPIKTRKRYNRTGEHTFSEYELITIKNGKKTITPLSEI